MDWQGLSYLFFIALRYGRGIQLDAICNSYRMLLFRTTWRIVDYVLDLVFGYSLLLGWRQERKFAQQWDYRFSAQLVSEHVNSYNFQCECEEKINSRE